MTSIVRNQGDDVEARGPRNHFELAPARRYLFIAGGIGITPLLPMTAAAQAAGAAWELHYGAARADPAGSVHVERFAARGLGDPVRSEAFEVELALSGMTLTVGRDESVLDVIEGAGVTVLSSCHEGTCGTCETTVLAGEVDHRDSLLTPDEQAAHDTMFICVSRAARPRLVLEL